MLPFGGQGSNQAIEDAGALGQLLQGIASQDGLAERLQSFERLRHNRTSLVQAMSSVRVGREAEVQTKVLQYAEPGEKGQSHMPHLVDISPDHLACSTFDFPGKAESPLQVWATLEERLAWFTDSRDVVMTCWLHAVALASKSDSARRYRPHPANARIITSDNLPDTQLVSPAVPRPQVKARNRQHE